ncbi:MAG: hypothetical protein QM804_02135 [Propionicimonas sp.]
MSQPDQPVVIFRDTARAAGSAPSAVVLPRPGRAAAAALAARCTDEPPSSG